MIFAYSDGTRLRTTAKSGWLAHSLPCMALILTAISAVELHAQQNNDLTAINFEGKIVDGSGNILQITDDKGGNKTVQLPEQYAQTNYSGKALLRWLQPEMFVRFTAKLDEKGKAISNVPSLVVFEPNKRNRNQWTLEEVQKNVPGIYPAGAAKGTNLADQAKPNLVNQDFNIVGQIVGEEKGILGVQTGVVLVQVPVTDKTEFEVQAYGAQLAKPGDTIKVRGLFSAKAPNEVYAQNVSIVGEKPLGEEEPKEEVEDAKKKNTKKAKSKTKSKKPPKNNNQNNNSDNFSGG